MTKTRHFLSTHFSKLTAILSLAVLFAGSACTQLERSQKAPQLTVAGDDPIIEYSGRRIVDEQGYTVVGYSGARARLRFRGESVAIRIADDTGENFAQAWVDGKRMPKFKLEQGETLYPIASDLGAGVHEVEVARVTECFLGLTRFAGFEVTGSGKVEVLPWQPKTNRKIEFIGDSITCGYGVETDEADAPFLAETENFFDAYSGLLARRLEADFLAVSRSGIGMTRNYDGPFEGSEVDMPSVYEYTFYENYDHQWNFDTYVPDLVCINLGTNDFSTTGVKVENYVRDYIAFAGEVLQRYPEATLLMIQGSMNNSPELRSALDQVYAELEPVSEGRLHRFELSPQGELGYGASYHPNRAQSLKSVSELEPFVRELMGWQ